MLRPLWLTGFVFSALFTLAASFLLVVNIPDAVGMIKGTRHTNDIAFFYLFVLWFALGISASFVFWLLSKPVGPAATYVWDVLCVAFVGLYGWNLWFFITRSIHSGDVWDVVPAVPIGAVIATLLWRRYKLRTVWLWGLIGLLVLVGSPLLLLDLVSR